MFEKLRSSWCKYIFQDSSNFCLKAWILSSAKDQVVFLELIRFIHFQENSCHVPGSEQPQFSLGGPCKAGCSLRNVRFSSQGTGLHRSCPQDGGRAACVCPAHRAEGVTHWEWVTKTQALRCPRPARAGWSSSLTAARCRHQHR